MMQTSRGLVSLPVELLDLIAVRLDPGSFVALLQTCKRFKRIYEPWVFSKVRLPSLAARRSFERFITHATRLRPFVKSLRISYKRCDRFDTSIDDDMHFASAFTRLKDLTITINDNGWSLGVKRLLKHTVDSKPFKNLTSLTLRYTHPSSRRNRWSVRDFHQLCSLPSIDTLRLTGFRFHDLTAGRTQGTSQRDIRVRRLEMSMFDTDVSTFQALLQPLGTLSSLTLDAGCYARDSCRHCANTPYHQHRSRATELISDGAAWVDALGVLAATLEQLDLSRMSTYMPHLTPWLFGRFTALRTLHLRSTTSPVSRIELPAADARSPVCPPKLEKLYLRYPPFDTPRYVEQLCRGIDQGLCVVEYLYVKSLDQPLSYYMPGMGDDGPAENRAPHVQDHDRAPYAQSVFGAVEIRGREVVDDMALYYPVHEHKHIYEIEFVDTRTGGALDDT